ncbi:MAG: hypothetical protein E3J64_06190 [Anaerolineales bacterium]|nr:MAG: hypothetical protein E3J64_06190 [Anaerolineales bacterium]
MTPSPNRKEDRQLNGRRSYQSRLLLVVFAALTLGLSGCGSVTTSWTGITVVNDRVYAADLNSVQVLLAADGSPIWSYPSDPDQSRESFYAAPAVGEGYVVAASKTPSSGILGQDTHTIRGLDAETGLEIWRFDEAIGEYIEGGAIGEGVFVIGSSDGSIYALELESGDLLWTFQTGHRVWASPLIVEDVVYMGSTDRHLYALGLFEGELRWDFQGGGAFAGTPALWERTLFIGAFDDTLYAIDADTGTEVWSLGSDNWFWGSPTVYGDTLYATDVGGRVYAIDPRSGEEIWHVDLDTPVRAGPALSDDGERLLVASQGGGLHSLLAADGHEVWVDVNQAQLYSSPIISGSVAYQPLLYGQYRIRALQLEDKREVWAYPPPAD